MMMTTITINTFTELLNENFLRKSNSSKKIWTKSLNHLKTSTGNTLNNQRNVVTCQSWVVLKNMKESKVTGFIKKRVF